MNKERLYENTVVFDFDGVIHSYRSGWQGTVVIPDPPVDGVKEVIDELRSSGYEVVVVSTRCYRKGGVEAIKWYLNKHGIEVDAVTGEKPPAKVYVDDRAITFDGKAEGLVERIKLFRPWYEDKLNKAVPLKGLG